jgi:ADP-ribose pyrophosphatase YjhB (NUDIX family)
MCQRSQEPAAGQWTVPSGFLECGESLEEGAARETFEETGVIVDPNKLELHAVINMRAIDQVAVGFIVELASEPLLQAGAECLDVAFLSEEEMANEQMAWRTSMGDAPDRFFRELRNRMHTISLISLGSSKELNYKSRQYKVNSVLNLNNSHEL